MKKLLTLSVLIGLLCSQVYAKQGFALSLKTFKALEQAQQLITENQEDKALKHLHELLEKKLSHYEKSQAWSVAGAIHYRQNRPQQAIQAFSQIVTEPDELPAHLYQRTLKTLTQLHLTENSYDSALTYGQKLVLARPESDSWVLLAQVYYRLEDFKQALNAILEARAINQSQGKTTKESTLVLQNATLFELEKTAEMVEVLNELISLYPRPSYLLSLASVYGHLEQLDKQTALMETLYERGDLDHPTQLVSLASLYLTEKVPFKAARLLKNALAQQSIKASRHHYEMLAQAWLLAAEWQKASGALSKAAELSEDGNLYLRLAQGFYDEGAWPKAQQALVAAFDKGLEPKESGEAWLLTGLVRFQQGEFMPAIEACEKAKTYQATTRLAENWIDYIANEKARAEALAQ